MIFAIDEIQNEFNSQKWADFPEELLSEITQQRKQKIKIIMSAQCYKDVVVQIRRQVFNVIECKTLFSRWTFLRCFDAYDYDFYLDNLDPEKKRKIPRKWRYSFVQSDKLRTLYDSYKKVERLKKLEYTERSNRVR